METRTIVQLFDFTGKSAIVTGGAMGIGLAIALRLAEAGASVMIADIDLEAASQTVEQIRGNGGRAQAIRADVASVDDVGKMAQATMEAFGSIDILVNNAGIFPIVPNMMDISGELWDKVLGINLKGAFLCSQAVAREMIKAGRGGKIVNIASKAAFHPRIGMAPYSASKAGVVMLTKSLALELAPDNILVNAVAPGGVITPGTSVHIAAAPTGDKPASGAPSGGAMLQIPLRRLGEPDDIAKVVLFLASAASDYMTGSLVLVDGGWELA